MERVIHVTYLALVLLTVYFQSVLGWWPLYSGFGLLPMAFNFIVGGGWAAAKLQRKLGLRRALLLSTSLLTGGAAWLT